MEGEYCNTQLSSPIRYAPATSHEVEVHIKNRQISDLRQEIDRLHKNQKRYHATEKQLRAENACLLGARRERELAGNDPLELELYAKDQQIMRLHDQVYSMRKLATFAQLDPNVPIHLQTGLVEEMMDTLAAELGSIIHGHDSEVPLVVPDVKTESESAQLLKSVIDEHIGWGTDDQDALLARYFAKVEPAFVIQAMVLAALRQWVFETDFPNFNKLESPFLEALQDVLHDLDGWYTLRNATLATLDRLVNCRSFKEERIPMYARELAARLTIAIAPLFDHSSEATIREPATGDPRHTENIWDDRLIRFTTIFERALLFKAATVLSSDQYEFLVYPPKTFYEAGESESESAELTTGINGRSSSIGSMWILAMISVFRRQPSIPRVPVQDAIMNSRNFVTDKRNDTHIYQKALLLPKAPHYRTFPQDHHSMGAESRDPRLGPLSNSEDRRFSIHSTEQTKDVELASGNDRSSFGTGNLPAVTKVPRMSVRVLRDSEGPDLLAETTEVTKATPISTEDCPRSQQILLGSNVKSRAKDDVTCYLCHKRYSKKGNRDQHVRRCHPTAIRQIGQKMVMLLPLSSEDQPPVFNTSNTINHGTKSSKRTIENLDASPNATKRRSKIVLRPVREGVRDGNTVNLGTSHTIRPHHEQSIGRETLRVHSPVIRDSHDSQDPDDVNSIGHVVVHPRVQNNNPLQCSKCRKVFSHLRSLKNHQTDDTCARCVTCDQQFYRKPDLRRHTDKHHPLLSTASSSGNTNKAKSILKTATCPFCEKSFSSKVAVQRHLKDKACPRCLLCDVVCKNVRALRHHHDEFHSEKMPAIGQNTNQQRVQGSEQANLIEQASEAGRVLTNLELDDDEGTVLHQDSIPGTNCESLKELQQETRPLDIIATLNDKIDKYSGISNP